MNERERQPDISNGLDESALADHGREDIGGAGGSSGGGTIAGCGEPSGALADEAANRQPGSERLSGGATGS